MAFIRIESTFSLRFSLDGDFTPTELVHQCKEAGIRIMSIADHEILLPYRKGGERSDNPFVNFYWDYHAQGKPCYVEVDFPELKDAISLIKKNGGKAVLAHPGKNLKGRSELFEDIAVLSIDGVEVFCSYHDEQTARYFYKQALKHSLIVTCGSDYHGKKTICQARRNRLLT